ncbi:MBL fold metallo-hydrolase [Flavobacteriales bacterium]|nr:MBL fold metallo-hydrolase [Flavobacteriales bacterium]
MKSIIEHIRLLNCTWKQIFFSYFLLIAGSIAWTPIFSQQELAPEIILLGIAQDGGYPHIGCERMCCNLAHDSDTASTFVVSIALIDPKVKKWWLFEATPDMTEQLQLFKELTDGKYPYLPAGIFITHAHMGHYTGLMELGREALGAKGVHVHVLPIMADYLSSNGPWSQLVQLKNISLIEEKFDSAAVLSASIKVIPIQVPHRDEFSETSGYKIITSGLNYLFVPDIDKWSKWNRGLANELNDVDVAFIDGTFLSITELPFRNINTIPHPLISETMELLENEADSIKNRVVFIHFNHTNKLMWDRISQKELLERGYRLGKQGNRY